MTKPHVVQGFYGSTRRLRNKNDLMLAHQASVHPAVVGEGVEAIFGRAQALRTVVVHGSLLNRLKRRQPTTAKIIIHPITGKEYHMATHPSGLHMISIDSTITLLADAVGRRTDSVAANAQIHSTSYFYDTASITSRNGPVWVRYCAFGSSNNPLSDGKP